MSVDTGSIRILVIEDEDHISRILSGALDMEGYGILGVSNVEEALPRLAESEFEVALLRLSMQEVDNWEILRTGIRTRYPDIAIVLLMGISDTDLVPLMLPGRGGNASRQAIAAREVVAHLTRPLPLSHLIDVLSNAFDNHDLPAVLPRSRYFGARTSRGNPRQ